MPIAYPLTATFRLIALSPEVQVRDAHGEVILQVKQKLLTLREATTVFADEAKTVPLYRMEADRVIGFGAVRRITRVADDEPVGSVRAAGLRSIWRTRYTVADPEDHTVFTIHEENPWVKMADALVDEIPVLGWVASSFINPTYLMEDEGGTARYRITKRRSFVERNFTLEQLSPDAHEGLDERLVALALVQVIFLERDRG